MRRVIIILIIVLIFLGIFSNTVFKNKAVINKKSVAVKNYKENIIFDVSLGRFKLGRATFIRQDDTVIDGKELELVTFETKLFNFYDLEKIYSDPQDYLPFRIIRQIKGMNINESITENYNQKDYVVSISKAKGSKKEDIEIKKSGPIHNAVMLPFYLRRIPELSIGWSFNAYFPSGDFTIKLISIERIKVPFGEFEAYRFKSIPGKFEIWISKDDLRLPLKIKGSGMLGYTLTMKDYKREL